MTRRPDVADHHFRLVTPRAIRLPTGIGGTGSVRSAKTGELSPFEAGRHGGRPSTGPSRRLFGVFLIGMLVTAAPSGADVFFPIHPSATARTLEDQSGRPFPILGRASWFLAALSPADTDFYLADCTKRGYTALEFALIFHDPRGRHVPFNDRGHAPFKMRLDGTQWDGKLTYSAPETEAPDFMSPNEEYWRDIDDLLARCESHGFLAFVFPAYVGYKGNTDQGWMKEMEVNGTGRMRAYGEFIARRYQNQRNIVWMLGGDHGKFTVVQMEVERALIDGLVTGAPGGTLKLRSAEWQSETIGTDQPDFGRTITLNGAYSFDGYTVEHCRRAYGITPVRPAFLLEEPYDEEFIDGTNVNPRARQPVRRFQWWGWLNSVGGYISGNGYVWPFIGDTWRQHLDTQGARDMARLNAFIKSLAWHDLVPSGLGGMRPLIASGGSCERASDYVAAAATLDGRLLVAYCPPDHAGAFSVDLGAMRGPARARWFDPTSAAYQDIASSLPNTGPHCFIVPGKNSAGDADWVLVIEAGSEKE